MAQLTSRRGRVLPAGTPLGDDLVVVGLLGRGGMGSVYRAHDQLLERDVAVKVLELDHDDADAAVLRVLQEARAAAQLLHPCIVPLHRAGVGPQGPFLEMALVEGPSLRGLLQQTRPPIGWLASCVAQLAAALQLAHDRGVVHCDVKPDNILLRHADLSRPPEPVLADFGLARCIAAGTANQALSHGTIAYLAPEHALGPPLPASDQFALAVLTAELLSGERPARGDWQEAMPVPAGLAPAVAAVLRRAGSADPAARFANMEEFADALLGALGQRGLRPALSGAPAHALGTLTSAAVPIPLAALASQGDADQLLCALLAVLPADQPDVLGEAWGGPLPQLLLTRLLAAGRLQGSVEQPLLADAADREAALAALPPKVLRQVQAAAARAMEARAPRNPLSRCHAQRLWLGARQPAEAARLALEEAWTAQRAATRARHLGRAAALLANPAEPLPWLRATVAQLDWLLRIGACEESVAVLAEAQGVLMESAVTADHPFAVALRRHAAEQAAWSGRTAVAAALVQGAYAQAVGDERLLLAALAADLDLPELTTPEPTGSWTERWPLARTRAACWATLHTARARQATRSGAPQRGERLALRALDAAREAADPLAAGAAATALAEAQLRRNAANTAQTALRQAADALRSLGPTAAAVAQRELTAEVHDAAGKPWQALAAQLDAASLRTTLGLPPPPAPLAAQHNARLARLGGPAAIAALQCWPAA